MHMQNFQVIVVTVVEYKNDLEGHSISPTSALFATS